MHLERAGRGPNLLNCRQQQPDQNRDDGNDDQQFNESERTSTMRINHGNYLPEPEESKRLCYQPGGWSISKSTGELKSASIFNQLESNEDNLSCFRKNANPMPVTSRAFAYHLDFRWQFADL